MSQIEQLAYQGEVSLLLFTKIPGLQSCKTRLLTSSKLPERSVEQLATAFLFDTLSILLDSSTNELLFVSDPIVSTKELERLSRTLPFPVSSSSLERLIFFEQTQKAFDERLIDAVTTSEASSGVLILGSDSPTLSRSELLRAFRGVEAGKVVLGPTSLGGLYLIGLPKPLLAKEMLRKFLADAFTHTSQSELETLTNAAKELAFACTLLEPNYDIDIYEDLLSVKALLGAEENCGTLRAKNTFALASRFLAGERRDPENNRAVAQDL